MSDMIGIGFALFLGALLGVFFFGGLWWTIQRGIASEWVAVWFIASLLLRTMVVIVGFYFVAQYNWSHFAACVVGFLLTRIIVVKWLGRDAETEQTVAKLGRVPCVQCTQRASSSKIVPAPMLPSKETQHEA
ncbi:MAG: ATP synthase subunit I [Planctomycetales bacterium]|nr:ATP synthase subunit I [Planctomycetales bacterium]